jgi:prevent-host-death family protein
MTKEIKISEDIVPLGEFKTQASRVIGRLRSRKRPIVITQNGKPAAVLVAPAEFDRLREQAEFVTAVREGLADSEAGRVIDDDELGRVLDKELGRVR